ncbi:MAG: multicopper oxidase domain-containing protein [Anaerolineales bacterium]
MGGTLQASAQGAGTSVAPGRTSAMPMDPTDESKVPHYFGPWPNWANSPFTLPNATIEIQGEGSGATAVAEVDPVTGGIASIQVTAPGNGYNPGTTSVVIGGDGSGATATATVNTLGVVISASVTAAGSGYTAPEVVFSGGGPGGADPADIATGIATGTAYGSVEQVTINDGGSGYTMPTVEFDLPDAPDGITAQAHAEMDGGGTITAVIIDNPGSGYLTAPNVAIHNGTLFDPISGATPADVTSTLQVTSVTVDTYGSGYISAPALSFSDALGTGTGADGTATIDVGGVTAITLDGDAPMGSGYLTVGMRKFIDDLPGVCTPPDCPSYVTDPTAKYIPLGVPEFKVYKDIEADEYVIGLVQYRTSFSSDLPPTLVRGYVQLETADNADISQHYPLQNELLDGTFQDTGYFGVTPPQWLGPTIVSTKNKPVRIVFHNLLPADAEGDLFLPVDATMMGAGMGPMDMMGMDPMNDNSVMDEVRNPTCGEYPKDGMNCFKDNRATLHLHGGITPWISDGTPHQWITPADEMTMWPQGVSVVNVPDMSVCEANDDGCMTFYYTNQQSARLMFYHDHSWGITRLNVYAGEAAGYLVSDDTEKALMAPNGALETVGIGIPLIVQDRTFVPDAAQLALQDPTWDTERWGTKGSFWYHHVYMPAQNPGDPGGMSAYGRWMYGPWFWPPAANAVYGPIENPYYDPACHLDDPATWTYDTDPFCEPLLIPGTPNISAGMEQFNDTPIVNGVAYPKITLDPKSYRFRMLNAANDRFFNFQWYVADPTQGNGLTEVALNAAEVEAAQTDPVVFPTPDTTISLPGPDWIQIGTEGGFLPAPVVIDGQQHTTWITDPTRFDVGNVDQHSLLLAPAERADVIVDFSKFAGKTLILYNDAPAAFPARVPSYDYYTGAPDLRPVGAPEILPGYGPNTRTIMQVTISNSTPAAAFNLIKLRTAFRHNASGTGVFESGQHPIIVGQAAYNSAYGTSFAASSNCNAPGSTLQRCDGLVRVNDTQTFGFNTLRAPNVKMSLPLQPKAIVDETGETTFDEYGRMTANLGVESQPPVPGNQNVVPYPYVNPGTEYIDATNLPKQNITYDANGLPVSDVKITPIADAGDGTQIWRITHNGVDTHPVHFHLYDVQLLNRVTWDNIVMPPEANELGWKDTLRVAPLEDTIVVLRPIIPELPWESPNSIRRLNPMMLEDSMDMFHNIDPQGIPTTMIMNDLVNFGWEYVYHCHILSHEEMDMMRPVSVAVPPLKPDGLAYSIDGSGDLVLAWNDNSITETSFVVQRMDSSLAWVNLATIDSPLNLPNSHEVRTYTDTGYVDTMAYQYRVIAKNTVGYGHEFPSVTAQSMSEPLLVGEFAFPPESPSALSAALVPGPQVALQWTDNSVSETGFSIERCSGPGCVDFAQIDGVGANITTYTDPTVAASTSYSYRVLAFDADGNSLPSNVATIATAAPPQVASLVRSSVNPTGAATVNYSLTFSESVTGVDVSDFAVTVTGDVINSSVKSVSGFGKTYTVVVNTGSGTGTLRLDLMDNNSIVNALANPLGGAGVQDYLTGEVYDLNRIVPTVVSIVRAMPNPTNAASLDFTVTFSEPVTGVNRTDFVATVTGSITGASVTTVSPAAGPATTYTVSVNTGSGVGTLRLDLIDNDTIVNSLANPLGGIGIHNYLMGEVYDIDRVVPTVVSILRASVNPSNALSVDYTVTFSEPVTGVDTTDFAASVTGGITGQSVTNVTPVSAAIYTVSVDTGSGDGTLRLDLMDDDTILDAFANPIGGVGVHNYLTGEVYDIDKTVPAVVSIVRALPNPTGLATVEYTVTFSEVVTGVDAGDFALTPSGVSGASVTGVTPVSGTTYTVSLDTGSGNGTLRLDLMDNDSILDTATNPLGGAGANDYLLGEVYDVDKTFPTVVSIVRALPNPSNLASVDFTVTFSEPVTGVDAGDFALALSGVTGASVTGVTLVSGTTYTIAADTGTGSGTLRLDLMDDDTILDAASNPLGGAGANDYLLGEVYDIDKAVPTVVSIARALPNPSNLASVDFTVTFSEPVTGVDVGDFALTFNGLTGPSVTGMTPVSGTTYTVAVATGSGDGTLRLDLLDDNTILDAALNSLGGAGAQDFLTGEVYDIDKTVPTVVSIVRASANPTGLASVNYTVTFSENVTGVDTGDFALILGGGVAGASVTSVTPVSGTVYTVAVDTGLNSGTLRLDLLDNNSILDAATNPLGGAGAQDYLSSEVYDIDKIAPEILSIVRASADPTNAASVDFTVTFSEAVTDVDVTDFALTLDGTMSGASVAGVTPVSAIIYTVTVATGTGSGTLRLDVLDDNTILDLIGNPLGGPAVNHYLTGELYNIDRTGPTVVSILRASPSPTNAPTVTYIVTFSEPATGVDRADFSLTRTGALTNTSVRSVSGSGTTYTVSVNTGVSSGTLRLDLMDNNTIVDVLGNVQGGPGLENYTGGEIYDIDRAVPTVVSIVRAMPNPTNAASVNFTVTFSEPVTGVNTTDFTITKSSTITGVSVTSVSGSGSTYTVAVKTGSGSGTLRLNLMDNNTIVDALNYPLGGLGLQNYTTGETYNIDKAAPRVISIIRTSTSPTGAASVDYTVTFSEAVTGVDATDFAFTLTGTLSGVSVASVSGSGTLYIVTVDTGTGSGTLRLTLMDDNSIIDAATNPLGGALINNYLTGQVYTISRP